MMERYDLENRLEALQETGPPPEYGPELRNLAPLIRKFLPMDSNDLVTIKADQVLLRVSADILRLCSAIREPISSPLIVSGLTAARLNNFLTVVAAKTIQTQFSPSFGDWTSALHAAIQLGCGEIRTVAIDSMESQAAALQPVPLVQLGLKYHVPNWVIQGFTCLIERREPVSAEEGASLGMETGLAIYRSREALSRARSQSISKDDSCTTIGLINKEPSLRTPNFENLEELRFPAPSETLLDFADPSHNQSNLIDLLIGDTVWTVTIPTLGSTPYFLDRAERFNTPEGGQSPIVDLTGEVEKTELESYLLLVNARRFKHATEKSLGLNFQQWVGALRLATLFGHSEARRFAIGFLEHQLKQHDPFDVIDAAKACNVDEWLESQYIRIAEGRNFPSEEEGQRLGATSVLAVCNLREKVVYRSGKENGYRSGKEDGYRSGKEDGYRSGQEAEFQAGFDGGFKSGFDGGFKGGFDAGFKAGFEK
ncbi:hypothetical protein FRC01_008381 [Tulasnella sp. 417]|nr:hypothetical protein FRC01_008381 [Tulasnella sp. 417]